jgi:putative transposase
MSEKYKVRNPEGIYFITCTITNWVDLLIKHVYKHILTEPLDFCIENKGLNVHTYGIMTSHFHAIVSSKQGYVLQDTVKDMKKHTSQKLSRAIKEDPESRREWI